MPFGHPYCQTLGLTISFEANGRRFHLRAGGVALAENHVLLHRPEGRRSASTFGAKCQLCESSSIPPTSSPSPQTALDVRVSATKVEPDLATVEVHGGRYREPGKSRFMIWLERRALQPGQRVSVEFSKEGQSSWPGKTVEELYPDEQAETEGADSPFSSRAEMLDQLTLLSHGHSQLSCKVALPTKSVEAKTESTEHGYAFGVSWHSHRPERARVSLHTYSIESMRLNQTGTYHVQESLGFGESASIEVGA